MSEILFFLWGFVGLFAFLIGVGVALSWRAERRRKASLITNPETLRLAKSFVRAKRGHSLLLNIIALRELDDDDPEVQAMARKLQKSPLM